MIKEALVYDDNVVTSNDEGNLSERENTPYIKEIIETENDIETINGKINRNKTDLCFYEEQILECKKAMKKSIFFLGILATTFFVTKKFNTNIGFVTEYLSLGLLIPTAALNIISIVGQICSKRKVHWVNVELEILSKKLKEKELTLEDYKAKQNTLNFEKKKEKCLLDFTESKMRYQDELEKGLETEIKEYKQGKKPKVYIKR